MPAVLHGPQPFSAEAFGPGEEVQMIGRGGSESALAEFATQLVDCHDGVAALVGVHAEYNHGPVLLCHRGSGPVGGHTSVGAVPRSYQATPAGPARRGPHKGTWPLRQGVVERALDAEISLTLTGVV
jgi:hypothetical protein